MKRQIMKLSDYQNQFTCVRDTDQEMEYALYEHWTANDGKYGQIVRHRRLIGRYISLWDMLTAVKERITL